MIDKTVIEKNSVTLQIPDFPFTLTLQTHGENDLVSQMIQRDKIWEAFETKLVIDNLHPGDCFIDIGANIGYYTVIAGKCVESNGKVFAFEPERSNFSLLQNNIIDHQLNNVQAFEYGLGAQKKQIDFFINPENRGDHRAFDYEKNRAHSTINIQAGDEFLKHQKVDFIKIDTQGYELEILQGLRKTISANQKHLKMIIEFWPFALKQNGYSADALLNELARYDFDIKVIDHINHQLVHTDIGKLGEFSDNILTVEKQGFINLFCRPCI